MPFGKDREAMAKAGLSHLPNWPRMLTLEQAAVFLKVSTADFAEHVTVQPVRMGRRVLYDRHALVLRYFDPLTWERRGLPPERQQDPE